MLFKIYEGDNKWKILTNKSNWINVHSEFSVCAKAGAPTEGYPTMITGLGYIFTWLSWWFKKKNLWLEDLPHWLQT